MIPIAGHWKIIQLAPSVFPIAMGGIEKHVYDLSRALVCQGHQVKVFTRDGKYKIELNGEVTLTEKGSAIGILRSLLVEDYDILHLQGIGLGLFADVLTLSIIKLRGKKLICTPHGAFERVNVLAETRLKYKIYRKLTKVLPLKLIDSFICVYPNQKDLLYNTFGIPKDKITFIPNAIPEQAFNSVNSTPFIMKHNLQGKQIICFIGRLHPLKRVSDIIEIMPRLCSICPQKVILLIVGPDGGDKGNIINLIHKLNIESSIRLLGSISDEGKIQALNAASIFVTASSHEAFGISTAEAMAQGVPVVSASNQGARFLLDEARYGLLYEIGDKNQLLEKILYLLNNPEKAKKLGEKGKERAREFNLEEVVRRVEMAYAKLI